MDQPKIPTLKDSQKPQVKIRGLEAGVTLFDRLKQFKKKDLAFILAGLGTLFMAPLAEHFMMAPETGDATLQPGWGQAKGGTPGFPGNGNNSYEPGPGGGLAPGNTVGGGSDVITPLNVRDPSALVMGPGATQQPPAGSAAPANPPPTAPVSRNDSDLKDALAQSAAHAGSSALKAAKAVLPVPKVALNGSALHGLGAVSGGSSTSAGVGGVSSAGLGSNKATTGGGGTNLVRPTSGYKGVARGQSSGGGGLDALKAAADKAAGDFNRGNAANDLSNAAATSIPNGGTGTGGGGQGGSMGTDKGFGGDQNKDGKNVGESLAFLKAKAMQEAKIALWAKEQEAGDGKLEMLKIRNSMAEAVAGSLGKALGDFVSCPISQADAGGLKGMSCWQASAPPSPVTCNDSATGQSFTTYPGGQVLSAGSKCSVSTGGSTATKTKTQYYLQGSSLYACPVSGTNVPIGYNCKGASGDGKPADDGGDSTVKNMKGVMSDKNLTDLKSVCSQAATDITAANKAMAAAGGAEKAPIQKAIVTYATQVQAAARSLIASRDAMFNGASGDCDSGTEYSPLVADKKGASGAGYASAYDAAVSARDTMGGKTDKDSASATGVMKSAVPTNDKVPDDKAIPGADRLNSATKDLQNARDILKSALAKSNGVAIPNAPDAVTKQTDVQTGVAQYNAKLTGAKSALASYADSMSTIIGDGSTGSNKGRLTTDQELLKTVSGDGQSATPVPSLKQVIAVNKGVADAEKRFTDNGGTAVDATKPANGADGGKTVTIGQAYQAVQDAIGAAQKSLGSADSQGTGGTTTAGTGAVKAVDDYVAAYKAKPSDPQTQTLKDAAVKALADAKRDDAAMQSTQSGMLDAVSGDVRGVPLPSKQN